MNEHAVTLNDESTETVASVLGADVTNTADTAAVEVVEAVAPTPARRGRKPDPSSKLGRAREIFANATDKSSKALIPVFVDTLGVSKDTASTYYYLVKKAVG